VDFLRPAHAFDRRQQRTRWLAVPVAVVKKFSDDGAGRLAALVAYYAFFSIFPLLLVFVTVLGFVFHGDQSIQDSIINSLKRVPVIGTDLQDKQLKGQTVSLVIGILGSLWAGLGVTDAAQNAFDTVWAVPIKERTKYVGKRLRGLGLVTVLGALFVVSSVVSGLVVGGLGGTATKVAGIVLALLLNFAMFAAAFRLLTSAAVPTRSMWLGVVVGGVVWLFFQLLGGVYVDHVIKRASNTYGTFATVIGLLVWLHVGAQITLYAAELNVVVVRRLWPRSLLGPPAIPADEEALTALAKVEERTEAEHIEVEWKPPSAGRAPP
jgi:YihY family inner membrane protein